ncbi:MAG: 16S rRNA processing protein RimM [Crocinitomicaceae bacterium]|nr:16S rRNA processing protein RimM [Crocinitomicaceae bacterium]
MNQQDCYILGHIAKSVGFKGQVSAFIDATNPYEYSELESVFVEINKALVPFFIQSIDINDKGFAKIKFEGVDTEEDSKALLQKQLYLPLTVLPPLEGNHFYYHEVEGFKVFDKQKGLIGIVIKVLEVNNNPLLEIDANGKEVLIPLQDEFLLTVDRENQRLEVDCPDGLIDLYLNE